MTGGIKMFVSASGRFQEEAGGRTLFAEALPAGSCCRSEPDFAGLDFRETPAAAAAIACPAGSLNLSF